MYVGETCRYLFVFVFYNLPVFKLMYLWINRSSHTFRRRKLMHASLSLLPLGSNWKAKVTVWWQISEHQEDHHQQRSVRGKLRRPGSWTWKRTDATLHFWLVHLTDNAVIKGFIDERFYEETFVQLNESPLEDDSSSELLLVAMILLFVMKRCEKSSFLCHITHAEL